jgi:hypothetical protein
MDGTTTDTGTDTGPGTEPTVDAGTPDGAKPPVDGAEPPVEPTTGPIEPPAIVPPTTTDPQLEGAVTTPPADVAAF